MGPLEVLILVIIWFLPAFLVARYAANRGQNLWLFLLLGIVVSWVVSLIVALLSPDKRDAAAAQAPSGDLDRLAKLADLHKQGVLSDDEFAAQKAQVLGETRTG